MVINATAALVSQVAGFVQEVADRVTGIGPPPPSSQSAVAQLQNQLQLLTDAVHGHLAAAAHSLHLDTAAVQVGDFLHHQRTELTENFSNWLVVYGPFLPIIFFLWPLILSIIVTVLSASTWTFWLVTSVLVGIVQLIYVTYTFGVIFVDLALLSGLKTFAMIRSQIRYFTVKSGLQTKGSKRRARRRGRRREWRTKVDNAGSYAEYMAIDVDEPEKDKAKDCHGITENEPSGRSDGGGGGKGLSWIKRAISSRRVAANSNANATGNGVPQDGDRQRNGTGVASAGDGRPPTIQMSTKERMRKSQSCANLESPEKHRTESPTRLDARSSSNVENGGHCNGNVNDSSNSGDMPRVQSMHNLLRRSGSTELVGAELGMTGGMLLTTTARLREARLHAASSSPPSSPRRDRSAKDGGNDGSGALADDNESSSLKFLLAGVVKRNHLSVDDTLIEDARSVAESGRHHLSSVAREAIKNYNEEVENCLDWIAEASVKQPLATRGAGGKNRDAVDDASLVMERQGGELSDRIHLLRKMKQNMGRTALMLSGGGAQAMYHLGTVRALLEGGLYDEIKVVSGTSGGSISAAMCAIKTPEELLRDVCVDNVSTDFSLDGKMKKENIRWFPTPLEMASYWLKTRLMVKSKEFKRCCDYYYSDITFQEAFERTGKHVCITVSASRAIAGSGGGAQRLLLNHISTPHVTIASAVAASCALPGVMAPAKLLTKNSNGIQEPFEVDGVEWIDGSVQADLPFKRISTLFNVTNYIVAQTNFHVVPFLNKAHHPNIRSLYWRTFQSCEWDIRSRVLNLSRLGLFPKFFGQDVSKVFKQKYHGNLTLVPKFTTKQVFGMKALSNPTVEDMKVYLKNGQAAAWPYLTVIRDMIRVESKIDQCITRLEERYHAISPDYDALLRWNDDADSISISSTVSVANRFRMASASRETELLRQKVHTLERENVALRRQVTQLQHSLGIVNPPTSPSVGGKNFVDAPLVGGVLSLTLTENDEEDDQDEMKQ